MNRRVWTVLLAVIALLAIAPQLPQWIPLVAAAFRRIDLGAIWDGIAAIPDWLVATDTAHPWLAPVIAGSALGIAVVWLLVTLVRRRSAHRSARRSTPSSIAALFDESVAAVTPSAIRTAPVAAAPVAIPVAVPAAAPVAASSARFARPTGVVAATPPAPVSATASPRPARRGGADRRSTVHQLVADGRSIAEIARATGIGQDAIRGLKAGV